MKKPEIYNHIWVNGEYVDDANDIIEPLIDALIEAYHLIQSLKDTGEWGVNVHPIDEESIVSALTKAGVEL
jgi:hypothetical protein